MNAEPTDRIDYRGRMSADPLDLSDYRVSLPISFPKAQESFKVASPEFRTPIDMEPRLKVRVSGEGIVARMSGAFGEESDTLRWTVILDSASLEVLE